MRLEVEGNRKNTYEMVVLAAKRARQLREGALRLVDTTSENPLTVALDEIHNGKIDAEYIQESGER